MRATSQGVISTVAGNGFIPFSGEGGAATSAALGANAVAVDGAGNIYVADIVSSRVLKVSAAGTITTLAGNGAITFAGDGGPATRASFFNPSGVAADGAGNVYIADSMNNRVRKVNSAGTISTVAGNGSPGFSGDGGPATGASLSMPMGVAVDSAGNLYIADSSNNRIRKVNTGGTISTVAGGALVPGFSGDGGPATAAGLFLPGGVALDSAGNIYIADIANNRIRKVNTAGVITTVAGNGTKGFSGDGGAASGAGLNLFGVHAGLAVDGAGNLYIPDIANHRIRKVDASGIISTVAGNGIAGFSGDGGPAINAGLNNPSDVAVDGAGNFYIADTTNNRVRKVTSGAAPAPPTISSGGIVNGASFQPGIVANSWATILGTNLSQVTDTWAKRHREREAAHDARRRLGDDRRKTGVPQLHKFNTDQLTGSRYPGRRRAGYCENSLGDQFDVYGDGRIIRPGVLPVAEPPGGRHAAGLQLCGQGRHIFRSNHGGRQAGRRDHPLGYRIRSYLARATRRGAGAGRPDLLDRHTARGHDQ